MLSNENDMINLQNYDAWFVLYMDDELTVVQKEQVEAFVAQHPHLRAELDLLRSTRLPADPIPFCGKEVLRSNAMKLNIVDESLLLYLDHELPATEKEAVEEKIALDPSYQWQYSLLQHTKLDPTEKITYPYKKELYRHAHKTTSFVWMRIAAAAMIVLSATLFFVTDRPVEPRKTTAAVAPIPAEQNKIPQTAAPSGQTALLKPPAANEPADLQQKVPVRNQQTETAFSAPQQHPQITALPAEEPVHTAPVAKVEVPRLYPASLAEAPAVALNKLIANSRVTSAAPVAYNLQETPEESADLAGDFKDLKQSSAKGFLRKITRFIEKRTGIGTVNADNEILVGAVALKLN